MLTISSVLDNLGPAIVTGLIFLGIPFILWSIIQAVLRLADKDSQHSEAMQEAVDSRGGVPTASKELHVQESHTKSQSVRTNEDTDKWRKMGQSLADDLQLVILKMLHDGLPQIEDIPSERLMLELSALAFSAQCTVLHCSSLLNESDRHTLLAFFYQVVNTMYEREVIAIFAHRSEYYLRLFQDYLEPPAVVDRKVLIRPLSNAVYAFGAEEGDPDNVIVGDLGGLMTLMPLVVEYWWGIFEIASQRVSGDIA